MFPLTPFTFSHLWRYPLLISLFLYSRSVTLSSCTREDAHTPSACIPNDPDTHPKVRNHYPRIPGSSSTHLSHRHHRFTHPHHELQGPDTRVCSTHDGGLIRAICSC